MVCTGRPNCVTNTNSVSLTEKNVRYRKTSASAPAPTHRYFKYESISILGNPLRSSRGRGNHREHSRTSDLDTTLHQEQPSRRFGTVHDQFAFTRQHLLDRLQVEPGFGSTGRGAIRCLARREAPGIAFGAAHTSQRVCPGLCNARLGIAARQRYLFVAVALGLIDEAILLFVSARDITKRIHYF